METLLTHPLLYSIFGISFWMCIILFGFILLPILVIFIVKKILKVKVKSFPSFKLFFLAIVLMVILANIFWRMVLVNTVYYEWDSLLLYYNLLTYESPVLDGSGSWIAPGWQQWYLYTIWLAITIIIYGLSAGIVLYKYKKHKSFLLYRKVVLLSTSILLLLSLTVSPLFNFVMTKITNPYEIPKETIAACNAKASSAILYRGNYGQLMLSDTHGKNIKKLLDQYGLSNDPVISPDNQKLAFTIPSHSPLVWIRCINSKGSYAIPLPFREINVGIQNPISNPSWSPDSTHLVMNYYGDLLILDSKKRTYSMFKHAVAIRDNHIDITKKRESNAIVPPYEIGEVLWAPNNIIYYTAFDHDSVRLFAYDYVQKTEKLIVEKNTPLKLHAMSPDGKILLIMEIPWAKTVTSGPTTAYKSYFYDIQTQKKLDIPVIEDSIQWNWSDDGKYILSNPGNGYQSDPNIQAYPTIITNVITSEKIDLNPLVTNMLIKKHLLPPGIIAGVQPIAMKKGKILIQINLNSNALAEMGSGKPFLEAGQINAFINLDGSIELLQVYPNTTSDTKGTWQERLQPVGVIQ